MRRFGLRICVKTIAASFPLASSGVEIANQLEGHDIKKRIDSLEAGMSLAAKVKALEAVNPTQPPPLHDWSIPTAEFLRRTVDVAVAYDGGFHPYSEAGKELIQPLAHACVIGNHEILMCREALELGRQVAAHKSGRIVILVGLAWYDFEPEPVDKISGLCICRLTTRDEEKWEVMKKCWSEHGLDAPEGVPITAPVRHTTSTWMGQEVGFIHSGEATDVMTDTVSFTDRQFDTSVISHFRKPRADSFKIAVTGVLSGRVTQLGSPVFTRDGTLLGILSDIEHYESDAGRRAVVRSLLGHPRFTKFAKKEDRSEPT